MILWSVQEIQKAYKEAIWLQLSPTKATLICVPKKWSPSIHCDRLSRSQNLSAGLCPQGRLTHPVLLCLENLFTLSRLFPSYQVCLKIPLKCVICFVFGVKKCKSWSFELPILWKGSLDPTPRSRSWFILVPTTWIRKIVKNLSGLDLFGLHLTFLPSLRIVWKRLLLEVKHLVTGISTAPPH